MAITIRRPVRVRVVVTEGFRERRSAEMRTALAKLDVVAKQLAARLEAAKARPDATLIERLSAEQVRNEQAKLALKRDLEKLATMEPGSEQEWGALEGSVEVEVGDDFSKIGACEIVVQDDKIVEIRDGLCP